MFQYQLDIGRIHGFIKDNPTIIQRRRKLAKGGKRLAEPEEVGQFVGKAIQSAGERFLERIHQEIYDAKPQWEKDAIQKDLNALASGEDLTEETAARPALSNEYLKSIGRSDLIAW